MGQLGRRDRPILEVLRVQDHQSRCVILDLVLDGQQPAVVLVGRIRPGCEHRLAEAVPDGFGHVGRLRVVDEIELADAVVERPEVLFGVEIAPAVWAPLPVRVMTRELAGPVAELLAHHPTAAGDAEPGELRGHPVHRTAPEPRDAIQQFSVPVSNGVDDDIAAVVIGVAEVELQHRLVLDPADLAAVARDQNERATAFRPICHAIAECLEPQRYWDGIRNDGRDQENQITLGDGEVVHHRHVRQRNRAVVLEPAPQVRPVHPQVRGRYELDPEVEHVCTARAEARVRGIRSDPAQLAAESANPEGLQGVRIDFVRRAALPQRVEVAGMLNDIGIGQIRWQPTDIGQPSPGRVGTHVAGPALAPEVLGSHVPVAVVNRAGADGEGGDHAVSVEQVMQWAPGVVLPSARTVAIQGSGQLVGNHTLDGVDTIVVFGVLRFAGTEAAHIGGVHRRQPALRKSPIVGFEGFQIGAQPREVAHVEQVICGRRTSHGSS